MTTPQYPQQPYGSQPYGQPPYGQPYPPPQPPRKKVVWPWLLLAGLFVLCGFGGCVAAISDTSTTATSSTAVAQQSAAAGAPAPAAPKAPPKSNIAPVGSAVRDGKFEFVVTAVDPPVRTVGDNQFLSTTAQGEYLLIHVDVSNIGNEARGYFGSNQTLIDDQGRKFTNDTRAEINVNERLSADINPGNKISVTIVFDVPPGTVPAALELHDSMFSGGVKVALR
ncbi:DUF4352 domain-containing protein [Nocardia sp. NBC_00508]|uniref:DUF4352 domain-containing protein n=1 Tax=Nocardia sp. NBC_00508 TaxID=2975992 RepID=UPI002E80B0E7|nr:DUF4352 domain-containing protein [Nocardia sp. NBC_00508]WUD68533.1 DUF4352 domain-containing protein [Nocardia sp. NBC_00508]